MHSVEACSKDGSVLRTFRLDPRRAYSIGRSPRCDLTIALGSISRRHAAIFCHAGVWRVLDCGSKRGIQVDGEAVHHATLRPDRPIRIGPLWLRLSGPARHGGLNGTGRGMPDAGHGSWGDDPLNARTSEAPALSDSGADGSFHGAENGSARRVAPRTAPHSTLPPEGPRQVLVVESGDCAIGLYDLSRVDHAAVGTDPACRIQLPMRPGVTPLHALLLREPRHWSVIDAGGGVISLSARYLRRRLRSGVSVDIGSLRLRMVAVHTVTDEQPVRVASMGLNGSADHGDEVAPVRR